MQERWRFFTGVFRPAVLAAGLCGGLLAAPASAGIIITDVHVPYYEGVTLHNGILGSGNSDSLGIAGQIVLTLADKSLLDTWCVDIYHVIYLGGHYTYEAAPFVSDNSGSSPATSNPLSLQQINDIGFIAAYGNHLMSTTPSNDWSAAIQAEIWDIEFHTTATGSAAFNSDLAFLETLLTKPHGSYGGYQIGNPDNQGLYVNQDLFVSTGPNNNPGVPEPLTLTLFATGLAGLAASRRRKKA